MPEPRVLLTVSGAIPERVDEQAAAGARPRADYRVLAERLGADVVDVPAALAATGRLGRVAHRLAGPGGVLAWYAARNRGRYDVLLSDGEQVGLPYAALTRASRGRLPRHIMITHVISTRSKRAFIRGFRLSHRIDRFVVYATRQAEVLTAQLGVPGDAVAVMPFMVDTAFFAPRARARADACAPLICSAGLERRDYPTLIEAVRGLDVDVVIAAASPWSTREDSTQGRPLPPNVEIARLDLAQLRDLYARADLVVMPLENVDFQAGITTILEAMAMGRAIICTRTAGQSDTLVDGVTGVYVPPGDAGELRRAIERLLADRDQRERLGAAAREWAVEHADVERYAAALAAVVEGSAAS